MLTPKQPVINEVLITYIDYSITENYRVAQKESMFFFKIIVNLFIFNTKINYVEKNYFWPHDHWDRT